MAERQFTRKQVERSVRTYNDHVDELMNALFQNWDSALERLLHHLDHDEVMKTVRALHAEGGPNADTWWNDTLGTVRGMVGSGTIRFPTDHTERMALIYRLLEGVKDDRFSVVEFCNRVIGASRVDEMLDNFNTQIVRPFTRPLESALRPARRH